MKARADRRLAQATEVLGELGLPRAQRNERSALCLLALLNLSPAVAWKDAQAPLMGITPIMDWAREHYRKDYAPNTRETVRRQTMHQFVAAGIALYNPDEPRRAVNSPKAVYQVSPDAFDALRQVGTPGWSAALACFRGAQGSLAARYANHRKLSMVPVQVAAGEIVRLSSGAHSELIRAIVEDFAARFAPGSDLIYVGDTGNKWAYFDEARLSALGVQVDSHGKMPDVVLHFAAKGWLLLVESVTSHGPVDGKRHAELAHQFGGSDAGLVFVTAFPDRPTMSRYLSAIAWETEVWVADAPTHLIHFNGQRFLGPYSAT